jgi:hypothetical protein
MVPLDAFASTLNPQITGYKTIFPRVGNQNLPPQQVPILSSGDPNAVWIKLLRINHGAERHTLADWAALIQQYENQPAYPGLPPFTPGT